MTIFNTALMQTLSPWIYKKIKMKKIEELALIAYITLVLIAGINIMLIAFAPEVVAVFAPAEYYDAIWVMPPVAMSVFLCTVMICLPSSPFIMRKRDLS